MTLDQWTPRTEDLSYAARIGYAFRQAEATILAGWDQFNRATHPADVDAAIWFLTCAVIVLDRALIHAQMVGMLIVPNPEAKAVADAWRRPAA